MKQVKDLCIGDKVYKAEIKDIISKKVDYLSLDKDTSRIEVGLSESCSSVFFGGEMGTFITEVNNEKYFIDYKNALKEQTKLRTEHYLYLLNKVEEAQKALSEFILEYSILR